MSSALVLRGFAVVAVVQVLLVVLVVDLHWHYGWS